MALSNFTKDVTNNVDRAGGVFVSDDGGTTWYDLGQVKDVELTWSAEVTDEDTAGRQKQLAANVEIPFVMQQTSDTELGALTDLVGKVLDFKFTTVFTDAAGAAAASGYVIENALLESEGSINFSGGESTMSMVLHGRVSISELSNLGSSQTLTFDA